MIDKEKLTKILFFLLPILVLASLSFAQETCSEYDCGNGEYGSCLPIGGQAEIPEFNATALIVLIVASLSLFLFVRNPDQAKAFVKKYKAQVLMGVLVVVGGTYLASNANITGYAIVDPNYEDVGQFDCNVTESCFCPTCPDYMEWNISIQQCQNETLGPGDPCTEDFQCIDGLECDEGVCECPEGQDWNESSQQCESEPGIVCGNGDVEIGEECDDNNNNNGDGCDSTCDVEDGWVCTGEPSECSAEECGDGIVAGDEECDDDNTNNGDGCDSTCDVEDGWVCTGEPSECSENCGDGNLDIGEECDDNNLIGGDGCSAVCTIEDTDCGNGQVEFGEECDVNDLNGLTCLDFDSFNFGTLFCDNNCNYDTSLCQVDENTSTNNSVCGNNIVEAGESCDGTDLNGLTCLDFDTFLPGSVTCLDDCTYNTTTCDVDTNQTTGGVCGNGNVESPEQCDDGNTNVGDGCNSVCQTETNSTGVCGNGILDLGEQCDDSNTNNGDGCDATCDVEDGWQCNGMPSQCTAELCGDNIVAGNEECDDGNTVNGDGCNSVCETESSGSGGGGGGRGSGSCTPQWECTEWSDCGYFSGTRTRECTDKRNCRTDVSKPSETDQCRGIPACSDGLWNNGEEGIDCGGNCEPCEGAEVQQPTQVTEPQPGPETEEPAPVEEKQSWWWLWLLLLLLLAALLIGGFMMSRRQQAVPIKPTPAVQPPKPQVAPRTPTQRPFVQQAPRVAPVPPVVAPAPKPAPVVPPVKPVTTLDEAIAAAKADMTNPQFNGAMHSERIKELFKKLPVQEKTKRFEDVMKVLEMIKKKVQ